MPNASSIADAPLLRIPPFPGAACSSFSSLAGRLSDADADALLDTLASLKVGGSYWAAQPQLPASYVLIAVADDQRRAEALEKTAAEAIVCAADRRIDVPAGVHVITGRCDPWHLAAGATEVIVDAEDELALIAVIAGVCVRAVGDGGFGALDGASRTAMREALQKRVPAHFADPFSGEQITAADAAALCGFWRKLIDCNRDIAAAVGFAFWKRDTVAPLLWGGSEVPFRTGSSGINAGDQVAVWRARISSPVMKELEQAGAQMIEVEDGFIRSTGLGADCVPPLSIVVDRFGAHFDPGSPSELEELIQNESFSPELLDRAKALRGLIVRSGLSKYASGGEAIPRRTGGRRHILVPGQVEDDRAVIAGGLGLTSNLELLRRVRADAPDAYILYKPHPDVEAGHRSGAIADDVVLAVADEVVRDLAVSALIDMVDEVHVNTSLAGFEALLRERAVTTHGVPFYAGWGLTRDLGAVPDRRTATRTLDQLVAAVLLLYPRYLDPVTGLPCPPEVLVRRLAEGTGTRSEGLVVRLRRLQGQVRRRLAQLIRAR